MSNVILQLVLGQYFMRKSKGLPFDFVGRLLWCGAQVDFVVIVCLNSSCLSQDKNLAPQLR